MRQQSHAGTSAFVLYPRGKSSGLQMPWSLINQALQVDFSEAQAGYTIKNCSVVLPIIYLGSRMHVL